MEREEEPDKLAGGRGGTKDVALNMLGDFCLFLVSTTEERALEPIN